MKTLIVVKSIHHQNTARVAKMIGDVLQAEIREPEEVSPELFEQYDLIGLGSGIYFGRFHNSMRRLISQMPVTDQPRAIFLFSTAGLSFLWRVWHWPLKRRLRQSGYRIVGEFSCRGWDTVGPLFLLGGLNRKHPNEKDLERARSFAQELKQN